MSRRVVSFEAEAVDDCYQFRLESSESVHHFELVLARPQGPGANFGGPLYLPVHETCLHIAHHFIRRAIENENTATNEINSFIGLWEVLYRRLDGMPHLSRIGFLPEPHDYFGGKRCRTMDAELCFGSRGMTRKKGK